MEVSFSTLEQGENTR